jgi:hypothetical protein
MNDPTSIELAALFSSDPGCRTLLDRAVQLLSAERDISYVEALDSLERGREGARATGGATLGHALRWLGADEYIAESLTILDRRDRVAVAAYENAAAVQLDQRVDQHGRVLLDADQRRKGTAPRLQTSDGVDIGRALADPVESERRYQRMRAVEPGRWDAEDGRSMFASADRLHLEQGFDLVASSERPYAAGAADRVVAKLDKQIMKAATKRAELRQLAASIDAMDAPASVRDAARRELDAQLAKVNRKPLRLLDKHEAKLRLLDGKKPKAPRLRAVEPAPTIPPVRLLDGGAQPTQTPAPQFASADFDARVRSRMAAIGAPESDYAKVLEQILGLEGA